MARPGGGINVHKHPSVTRLTSAAGIPLRLAQEGLYGGCGAITAKNRVTRDLTIGIFCEGYNGLLDKGAAPISTLIQIVQHAVGTAEVLSAHGTLYPAGQ
ncbi:MAG: hypothetical protein U0821_00835 [Chloroflexota bacterium]